MAQAWYIESGGESWGPYSLGELRDLKTEGRVGPGVSLRNIDEGVSYPFESMGYLFADAPATPAPRPAAIAARQPAGIQPAARVGGQRTAPRAGVATGARQQVWNEAEVERDVRPKATSALAPVGGAVAALAGLLAIALFLSPSWMSIEQDLVFDSGEVIILVQHLDFSGLSTSVRTSSSMGSEARKAAATLGALPKANWAQVTDRVLSNELFNKDVDWVPISSATQQTQMLSMALPILLLLGALMAGIAGFAANSREAIPGGMGGVGLLVGILAGSCLAVYRFRGLTPHFEARGTDSVSIILGPGFMIGTAGALILTIAGILLLKAGSELSKKRRKNSGVRR